MKHQNIRHIISADLSLVDQHLKTASRYLFALILMGILNGCSHDKDTKFLKIKPTKVANGTCYCCVLAEDRNMYKTKAEQVDCYSKLCPGSILIPLQKCAK